METVFVPPRPPAPGRTYPVIVIVVTVHRAERHAVMVTKGIAGVTMVTVHPQSIVLRFIVDGEGVVDGMVPVPLPVLQLHPQLVLPQRRQLV